MPRGCSGWQDPTAPQLPALLSPLLSSHGFAPQQPKPQLPPKLHPPITPAAEQRDDCFVLKPRALHNPGCCWPRGKKTSFPSCKWFKTLKQQQSETPGPLGDEGSRVFGWGWAEDKPSSATQQMNPPELAPASTPGLLPSGHGEQEQQDCASFHLSTPFSSNTWLLQQLFTALPALQDPGRCHPANSRPCRFASSGQGYSAFTGHLLALLQRDG